MKSYQPVLTIFFIFLLVFNTAFSMELETSKLTEENLKYQVEDNTDFAFELYQNIKKPGKNVFFSPFSISSALAMTYAGARGSTAKCMAETLKFNLDSESFHRAFYDLDSKLSEIQNAGKVKLNVANSLWLQEDFEVLQSFLDLTNKYYGAGIKKVDFKNNSTGAVRQINTWVEDKTNDKIKNLLTSGDVNELTKLILCNAIYFKGNWDLQFNDFATKERKFYLLNGDEKLVSTMKQEASFQYSEFENFSALDMPYAGKQVSLAIFLPKENDGLSKIEKEMTGKNVRNWLEELDSRRAKEAIVSLPKFKTTCRTKLSQILKSMGMAAAFGNADFSGISENSDQLGISEVIHQAFVELDEKGTEAAAATAVIMAKGCAMPMNPVKPFIFKVDHPFIFIIRDKVTNSILFIGKIVDPNQ
jgi:serpin B